MFPFRRVGVIQSFELITLTLTSSILEQSSVK